MEEIVRNCLGIRVGAAFRSIDRYFNRLYLPLGINHAHGQVLACLMQEGELRMGAIAERTGLAASSVSRRVKELCRRKLVRLRKDPEDMRTQVLTLAKRGAALREPLLAIIERANARIRRDVPEEDLIGLERACDLMARLR